MIRRSTRSNISDKRTTETPKSCENLSQKNKRNYISVVDVVQNTHYGESDLGNVSRPIIHSLRSYSREGKHNLQDPPIPVNLLHIDKQKNLDKAGKFLTTRRRRKDIQRLRLLDDESDDVIYIVDDSCQSNNSNNSSGFVTLAQESGHNNIVSEKSIDIVNLSRSSENEIELNFDNINNLKFSRFSFYLYKIPDDKICFKYTNFILTQRTRANLHKTIFQTWRDSLCLIDSFPFITKCSNSTPIEMQIDNNAGNENQTIKSNLDEADTYESNSEFLVVDSNQIFSKNVISNNMDEEDIHNDTTLEFIENDPLDISIDLHNDKNIYPMSTDTEYVDLISGQNTHEKSDAHNQQSSSPAVESSSPKIDTPESERAVKANEQMILLNTKSCFNISKATNTYKNKKLLKKTRIKSYTIKRARSKLTMSDLKDKVMCTIATQTDEFFENLNTSRNTVIHRIVTVKNFVHTSDDLADNAIPLNLSPNATDGNNQIIILKYSPPRQSSYSSGDQHHNITSQPISNVSYLPVHQHIPSAQQANLSFHSINQHLNCNRSRQGIIFSNSTITNQNQIPTSTNRVYNEFSQNNTHLNYTWNFQDTQLTNMNKISNPQPTPPPVCHQYKQTSPKMLPSHHTPTSSMANHTQPHLVPPYQLPLSLQRNDKYYNPPVWNLSKPKKNVNMKSKTATMNDDGLQNSVTIKHNNTTSYSNPVECDPHADKYDMYFNYVDHSTSRATRRVTLDDLDKIPIADIFDSGTLDISAYLQFP